MHISLSKIILSAIRLPKQWFVYCLLFAIIVQSLTPGVVLCFENDGHVEIELGSNGVCCSPFNESAPKMSTFISSEQECNGSSGSCVDVQLSISADKKHNSESLSLDHFVALLQTSLCSTSFIGQPTSKNSFLPIYSTVNLVSTIQTVILQV